MRIMLELFSGSGTVSKKFKDNGWFTLSIDNRKRRGTCEPDMQRDILELDRLELPDKVDVLWASLPCDVWSYACGAFHWDKAGNPKTDKCKLHIKILEQLMDLIDRIKPRLFFIENPRGRLRHYKPFKDWLIMSQGVCKTITLSSYGFQTTKPTNIFTNALSWKPKELDPFGRGAKVEVVFNNLTKCQRQKTPEALAQEIYYYCNHKIKDKHPGDSS